MRILILVLGLSISITALARTANHERRQGADPLISFSTYVRDNLKVLAPEKKQIKATAFQKPKPVILYDLPTDPSQTQTAQNADSNKTNAANGSTNRVPASTPNGTATAGGNPQQPVAAPVDNSSSSSSSSSGSLFENSGDGF